MKYPTGSVMIKIFIVVACIAGILNVQSYATAGLTFTLCNGNSTLNTKEMYNNGNEQVCFQLEDNGEPVTSFSGYDLKYTIRGGQSLSNSTTVNFNTLTGPVRTSDKSSGFETLGDNVSDYGAVKRVKQTVDNGIFYLTAKFLINNLMIYNVTVCKVGDGNGCSSVRLNLKLIPEPIYQSSDLVWNPPTQNVVSQSNVVTSFKLDGVVNQQVDKQVNLQQMSVFFNGIEVSSHYIPYQTAYVSGEGYKLPWYTSSVGLDPASIPTLQVISIQSKGATFSCANNLLLCAAPITGTWPRSMSAGTVGPAPVADNNATSGSYTSTLNVLYAKNYENVTPDKIISLQFVGFDQYGNKVNVFDDFQVCRGVVNDRRGTKTGSLSVIRSSGLLSGAYNQSGTQC